MFAADDMHTGVWPEAEPPSMLVLNWKLEPSWMWQPGGPSHVSASLRPPMPSVVAPDAAAVAQSSYETIASPQPPQSDAPEAARMKLPKLMPQVPGQHVYAPESSDSHQHVSPVAVGT